MKWTPHKSRTFFNLPDLSRNYESVLIDRLAAKGVKPSMVPGIIRILNNFFSIEPEMNLLKVNKQLQYIGWDDLELDYHTLQLAIACCEANCFGRKARVLATF